MLVSTAEKRIRVLTEILTESLEYLIDYEGKAITAAEGKRSTLSPEFVKIAKTQRSHAIDLVNAIDKYRHCKA